MVPTWKLNALQVLGLAAVGIVAGTWLKRRLPLLDRFNVPTPIVGGMLYAIAALALHDRVLNLDADVTLRDLLSIAFMTTIGLSARLRLVREGGIKVVWLLGISSLGAAVVSGGADSRCVSDRLHEFADHYGVRELAAVGSTVLAPSHQVARKSMTDTHFGWSYLTRPV
ncbi:MAG: sodium/glutamate symporter [Candidatus Solibacter sp.]